MPGFDILQALFHGVCSQWADHTWSIGGIPFPFCQRCTGLYLGAAAAVIFQLLYARPATARARWIYGLLLLQMVPFGLHWIPQTAAVRAASGVLFAFGAVGCLWLAVPQHWPRLIPALAARRRRTTGLLAGTLGTLVALTAHNAVLAIATIGGLGLMSLVTFSLLALIPVRNHSLAARPESAPARYR